MPHKRIGHKVRAAAVRLGAKAGKPLKTLGSKAITAAAQAAAEQSTNSNLNTYDPEESTAFIYQVTTGMSKVKYQLPHK